MQSLMAIRSWPRLCENSLPALDGERTTRQNGDGCVLSTSPRVRRLTEIALRLSFHTASVEISQSRYPKAAITITPQAPTQASALINCRSVRFAQPAAR
jgi:hypothetical protein